MLKHETYLQDCADAFVMLATNTSMTGMKVQIGGWLLFQSAAEWPFRRCYQFETIREALAVLIWLGATDAGLVVGSA